MKISGSDTEYELSQWANDWCSIFSVGDSHVDKKGHWKHGVISPSRVLLNAEEIERLRADRDSATEAKQNGGTPSSGSFWDWWILVVGEHPGRPPVGFLIPRDSHATSAHT